MTPTAAQTLILEAVGHFAQAMRRDFSARLDGRAVVMREADANIGAACDQLAFALAQIVCMVQESPGVPARVAQGPARLESAGVITKETL